MHMRTLHEYIAKVKKSLIVVCSSRTEVVFLLSYQHADEPVRIHTIYSDPHIPLTL